MNKIDALLKYLHNKKGQWFHIRWPYWVYYNHSPEPLEFQITEIYYDPSLPTPPNDDVAIGVLNLVVRLRLDNPFEGIDTDVDYADLSNQIEQYFLTHIVENYFSIEYHDNSTTHVHTCIIKNRSGRILHELEDWYLTPELLQQR
jgi:hypothetical protein